MELKKEQYERISDCFPKQRKPAKISAGGPSPDAVGAAKRSGHPLADGAGGDHGYSSRNTAYAEAGDG